MQIADDLLWWIMNHYGAMNVLSSTQTDHCTSATHLIFLWLFQHMLVLPTSVANS